jgi:hypothetical protein
MSGFRLDARLQTRIFLWVSDADLIRKGHYMRVLFIFCMFALVGGAAHAGSFAQPEGCTTWLTVQSRACRVSNYYTCTRDAPGEQWRADFDQQGLYFISRVDAEAQWLESIETGPMMRQTLDPGAEDPASFTELLDGADTFAFGLTRDNAERSRVRGFDRLTGKTVQIDGVTLSQTEFEFTETDAAGTLKHRSRGFEYIHPEWRLFFAGPSEWDGGDGYIPMDGSPVEFIFKAEPGFAATQPLFECDAVLSSFTAGSRNGN